MPSSARGPHEAVEVVERAERRLDGRVPAVRRADGPRAARVVRPRDERLFGPFDCVVPIGWIGGR